MTPMRYSPLLFLLLAAKVFATDYYLHPELGNDARAGTSETKPWRSFAKLDSVHLGPGDRVLLAAGQTFAAELELKNISGTADDPVIVASYANGAKAGRAMIDARGLPSAVHIVNSSHVVVRGLELTADGGEVTWRARDRGTRAAVLIELTQPGDFKNIHLDDLNIHDVFFESAGFERGSGEKRTSNGTQGYGYGIRLLKSAGNATLAGLRITNSEVTRVSHTGIKMDGGGNQGLHDVKIENVSVANTGGPGMQMSRVHDMIVSDSVIDGSGSSSDPRMWGRGSGMWTWMSDDVLIERNVFKNSSGPADSAGVHIDFGCHNVIIQYNLSMHNAGGFYEVLGDSHNTAYRYNVSINDGYRVRGQNEAFQDGKIFWLSGYVGDKKPESGPFNSYFYNNTIYVDATLDARVAIAATAEGMLVANNIFYVLGDSVALSGEHYKQGPQDYAADRTVFQNNLFLRPENWPAESGISDSAPVIGDPGFLLSDDVKIADLRPRNTALVADRGMIIEPLPGDQIGLPGGMSVERDILGNAIVGRPDIGAIEVSGDAGDEQAP